jgi:hypothetical protein
MPAGVWRARGREVIIQVGVYRTGDMPFEIIFASPVRGGQIKAAIYHDPKRVIKMCRELCGRDKRGVYHTWKHR